MTLSRVDLPEPDFPVTATNSPGQMTGSRRGCPPQRFPRTRRFYRCPSVSAKTSSVSSFSVFAHGRSRAAATPILYHGTAGKSKAFSKTVAENSHPVTTDFLLTIHGKSGMIKESAAQHNRSGKMLLTSAGESVIMEAETALRSAYRRQAEQRPRPDPARRPYSGRRL